MSASEDEPRDEVDGDRVLRAITDDDTFRVMVGVTTRTVRGALAAQQARGATARHFAELLTGAVLIRETMAPQYRVQAILKGEAGRGTLVADAHPGGLTRGLVQLPEGASEIVLGEGTTLQTMRMRARGDIFRSVVRPPAGGTVADALMAYLQESEQIASVIATGVHLQDEQLIYAGGYVVQLLPGAAREPLMVMAARLEAMAPIGALLARTGGEPRELLADLLFQMPYAQLDESPVHYGCQCNLHAVLASLATLSPDELAEMQRAQEVLEVSCDYCHRSYRVPSAQLQGLLSRS